MPRSVATYSVVGGIAALFLFLSVRSLHPDRWSNWFFGDTQTMLAVRHWQKEGFLSTKFLWIPQGYSAVTRLFDSKELNHHAHGIKLYHTPDLRGRRAYTHYPGWYAVPYGVLAKLGIVNKSIFQMVASAISCLALFVAFLFFKELFPIWLSALIILRYALTMEFFEYADSLATMPLDDLFRFLTLFLWFRARNSPWFWASYFVAVMTSWDSILFIPGVIFCFSIFLERKFVVKRMAWMGLLAVLGLSFQFLHSIWYLGWSDAVGDWGNAFNIYATTSPPELGTHLSMVQSRFAAINLLMLRLFRLDLFTKLECVLLFALPVAWVLWNWADNGGKYFKVLLSLFIAGTAFGTVFPTKIPMAYETRQYAPSFAVFWSLCVYYLLRVLQRLFSERRLSFANGLALAVGIFLLLIQIKGSRDLPRLGFDYPSKPRESHELLDFYNAMKPSEWTDRVVLQLNLRRHIKAINDLNGYAQVHPVFEYHADAPILDFPHTDAMFRDLNFIRKHTPTPFTPILVYAKGERDLVVGRVRAAGFGITQILSSPDGTLERMDVDLGFRVDTRSVGSL